MITPQALAERYIPFSSLRCTTEAFIDYCLPECTPKYNYALVGPGVSQSADQPVSLREPHGFQVGGVSMPHGKTNPAHMHFTCETFICTRGTWRIQWGFGGEPQSADIGEGDIISVPTWIYRGFTNVGVDDGFLFTALGGDHTGGVLWGPQPLEAAAQRGVFLTDDHRMIDTRRGQTVPPGTRLLQPMTPQEMAALRVWSPEEMAHRVVRFADLRWSEHGLLDATLPGCGAQLAAVVGLGMAEDRELQAPITNAHGVSIEWLRIPAGGRVSRHKLADKQVLIAKQGEVELSVESSEGAVAFALRGADKAWDAFSAPPHCWRTLHNRGQGDALLLLMTAGDHRNLVTWDDAVLDAAAAQGWTRDANGYVAPKRFVDRAQP